jgi:hypothetical protein
MDYKEMLAKSNRPYYTLAQIFAEVTGKGISVRVIQKLMKQYSNELILESILVLKGRSIDNPTAYLFGICKNKASTPIILPPKKEDVLDMFKTELNRVDKPVLRNPFNA